MRVARLALLIVGVFLLSPELSSAGPCGEFVFRPDEPGKVKVGVSKGGYEKYYRMTKAEDAASTAT